MWKAVIVTELEISDVIRYVIEITNDKNQWIIRKRYSDFSNLHKELSKKVSSSYLPTLPSKCYSLLGPDKTFLEDRKSALQRYLDVLSATTELSSTQEVSDFIKPEKPASATTIALPSQLPDVPCGDHNSSDLSEIDRLLLKPRTILRSLFIFQQELEIDPLLSSRISSIDFKRRGFMAGSKVLKRHVIEMNAFMASLEPRDPVLAEYLRKCLLLLLNGIKWVENLEKEETPLIKYFLSEAKAIRPVSIYEELAHRILAKYTRSQWCPVPEDACRLVASIKVEREHRKKVGQLIAWQLLREIQHSITDTTQDGVPIGFREALSRDDVLLYVEFPKVRRELLVAAAAAAAVPGYSPAKVVCGLVKKSQAAVAELNAAIEDLTTKRDGAVTPGGSEGSGAESESCGEESVSPSPFSVSPVVGARRKEGRTGKMPAKARARIEMLEKIGGNLKELCAVVDDLKRMVEENPNVDWDAEEGSGEDGDGSGDKGKGGQEPPASCVTDIPKEVDPMASSILTVPIKKEEIGSIAVSPPQPPSPQINGASDDDDDVDDDDDDDL